MLLVEPGMTARNMNLWNIKTDKQATRKETNTLIGSGDLFIKYLLKQGGIQVGLTKKASKKWRLFEVGESPGFERYEEPKISFETIPTQFEVKE